MLRGGGHQQAVDGRQWPCSLGHQPAPAVCNGRIDGQDAAGEVGWQLGLQSVQQLQAARQIGQRLKAFAYFAKGENAQVERARRPLRKPTQHCRVSQLAAQL